MFHQPLTPVGDSLTWSFLVAVLPIAVVLVLLGIFNRPAWLAAAAGLLTGMIIAVGLWGMPLSIALSSAFSGAVFAFWPVMWIVINALLLYNIAVTSGRFEAFRAWITTSLPSDRRVVLVVVGFCFGALLEGIAGFGAPVAITASLLIMVGFPAIDALVYVLIFDTTPVAFGALGAPVTVLSAVTGLPATALAAMIGRQLPLMAAMLPFYVIALQGGWRSIRALWPMLTVAGSSFGAAQFLASNFFDYTLTDVFSALISLIMTIGFLQVWRPKVDPEFAIATPVATTSQGTPIKAWHGWLPWIIVSLTVILWMSFKIPTYGQRAVPWPGLHNAVSITLYHDKPYAAIWNFQPLGTGTAILLAALMTAGVVGVSPKQLWLCALVTLRQIRLAVVTVMLIVALAYVMNYSGIAYTLGLAAASTGRAFVLFSPFLGWVAVFLSGSDTSGNALFGNLQVVAARQLHLDPVLFAATNSSGGVMGKMISPQNIATGISVTNLKGHEGKVLARTFWHSVAITLILVVIVIVEQFWIPQIIPKVPL